MAAGCAKPARSQLTAKLTATVTAGLLTDRTPLLLTSL